MSNYVVNQIEILRCKPAQLMVGCPGTFWCNCLLKIYTVSWSQFRRQRPACYAVDSLCLAILMHFFALEQLVNVLQKCFEIERYLGIVDASIHQSGMARQECFRSRGGGRLHVKVL